MTNETVTVRIAPDGSIIVHVEGVAGEGCIGLTEPLFDALGVKPDDIQRTPTDEFYETVPHTEQAVQYE